MPIIATSVTPAPTTTSVTSTPIGRCTGQPISRHVSDPGPNDQQPHDQQVGNRHGNEVRHERRGVLAGRREAEEREHDPEHRSEHQNDPETEDRRRAAVLVCTP